MPGFLISNFEKNVTLKNEYNEKCVQERMIGTEGYTIKRNTINKFMQDKLFVDCGDFIIITEGVIINKGELCIEKSWENTIKDLIETEPYSYFNRFRGSFSGAHYNKAKDEWVIYTDHTESKPVFYYYQAGKFIIASNLNYIVDLLKADGISIDTDEASIYDILTYGYMVTEHTPIKYIKKLQYGSYLIISENKIKHNRYYRVDNSSNKHAKSSDEELIEIWDDLFRKAVKLEYLKDEEYGYTSYASLSGGLDSRMSLWVAKELGFRNLVNVCFTESDYEDEIIAKKVSQLLGTDLYVKSLNGGNILADYNDVVRMNYGLTLYSGVAHSNSVDRNMNFDRLGIIHTGQLGGANSSSPKTDVLEGAYSQRYAFRVNDKHRKPTDMDFELFRIENREFRGNLGSQILLTNYSECLSPFQYKEFFDFYYSLPYNKRKGDYLYLKWIINKYPEAAQIPVERFEGGYITDNEFTLKLRKFKKYGLKYTLGWILWKCGLKHDLDRRLINNNMNPYDKWFEQNHELRESLNSYVDSLKCILENDTIISDQLRNDIFGLYAEGTVVEKTQAITALATLDIFVK